VVPPSLLAGAMLAAAALLGLPRAATRFGLPRAAPQSVPA
jgi:hypothetical protein